MHSFAHLSDVHIGAFRQPTLQKLALEAFSRAMDVCLERKVDFVVIGGDLFDSNIPDMGQVNSAVRKMREVKEKGVGVYVIYGSHDFSPTQTSIIDILESAGLFVKAAKGRLEDGLWKLEFTQDGKTGAKLCGISGRRLGIDAEYYKVLDRESLEREPGFKVFLLHGALTEYKPDHLAMADSIPVDALPGGFAYYAAGHLHERVAGRAKGGRVAYPGALFGADYSDLERSAGGLERGMFVVNFSDEVKEVEFVPVSVCDFALEEYDGRGKDSVRVQRELLDMAKNSQAGRKVFLLKAAGEMSGGRTSDIDFQLVRRTLFDRGAVEVLLSYQKLTSKEYSSVKVAGEDIREIEGRVFKESIRAFRGSDQRFGGDVGVNLSQEVLKLWKRPKLENEAKSSYDHRITSETIDIMGMKEAFE